MTRRPGRTAFHASQLRDGPPTLPPGMLSRSPAQQGRPVVPAEDMPGQDGCGCRPCGRPRATPHTPRQAAGGSAAGDAATGRAPIVLSSLHAAARDPRHLPPPVPGGFGRISPPTASPRPVTRGETPQNATLPGVLGGRMPPVHFPREAHPWL